MQLTHLGHACVLVEMADQRILIDPGTFSDALWQSVPGHLDVVVVTHQHPDHLDIARLPTLLERNLDARLVTDPQTAEALRDKGIEAEPHDGRTRVAPATTGSVTIYPVGHEHALIHDEIPRILNVGVRLVADGEPTLYHPGDTLDAEPQGQESEIDVLLFPLNAPWQRSREMTAFLRRYDAPHGVPIHDGLLRAPGRDIYLTQARNLGGERTEIHDLAGSGTARF